VPLMREGEAVGVISLLRSEVRPFTDSELALLSTFADQAVIAIENVRLWNETKEALDQQRASGEVLAAISSSLADTAPVFERILRSCESLFGGIVAGVNLVGDDGLIRLRAHHGPNREGLERVFPLPVDQSSGSGLCIVTTAWETRNAMHASVSKIRPIRERIAKTLGGIAEVEEWEVAAMNRLHSSAQAACARVTWLRVDRAAADEVIKDFHAETLPALRAVRGFCSTSLLVNRERGRVAVSVAYDGPEAMQRRMSRSDGRHQVGDNIIDVRDFDLVMPHLRVPDLASF